MTVFGDIRTNAIVLAGMARLRPDTDVSRLALLSGSSVQAVDLPVGSTVLAAPPPLDAIDDIAAAVRDALRFPLEGPSLDVAADRRARATLVVEPPVLPLPGVPDDPRREALAAVISELERIGIPTRQQTILVAGGLGRRAGRRELEALLRPEQARTFHGTVVVHDCEDEGLIPLGEDSGGPLRVSRTLAETDLVILVTAAETVLHGGPAALLGACGPELQRLSTGGESLLEPTTSPGWRLARTVARAVGARTPLLGLSLVLDHPRLTGRWHGWPHDPRTRGRIARSHLRRVHNGTPAGVRRRVMQSLGRELDVVGVLAGSPAAAHAEALLRGVAVRCAQLDVPVDTLIVPIPWKSASQPRDAVHPLAATTIGLGLALRLWRGQSPLSPGGAIVLVHSFRAAFARPSTRPYRVLYEALRAGGPEAVVELEATISSNTVALNAYREGRAPHPLLPFAEWDACATVLERAGRVIVGGCRDAVAARTLGFVPSHNVDTALQMAQGVAGGGSVGVLVAPPYPPLVVGP